MTEQEPKLLVELIEEHTSSRLRETFLLSVIVHLVAVLILVTNPELFQSTFQAVPVEPPREQEVTLLYQPPEVPKLKAPPPTPAPAEAERQAQARIERPVPPPIQYQAPAPRPPAEPSGLGKELQARQLPPIGLPEFPKGAGEPPKQEPRLEAILPPEPSPTPSRAQLTLPSVTLPGQGTDAILREMARQHAAGGGRGVPGGSPDSSSQGLDFNLPGPQILSDTMGVDFDPYMLRVYYIVRRNWYAVIPEIARLGRKGKVAVEFSILRDGRVPDLVLRLGSGTDSLDSAAMASIRLSNPFPALPAEFPGENIRLRFIYFYNLPIEY